MCVVCGCEETGEGARTHPGQAASDTAPRVNPLTGDLHFGTGVCGVSVPGLSEARTLKLEADVLGENARLAEINRRHFAVHGVKAFDLVSSPGSGKTSLLCKTVEQLSSQVPALRVAVIEGDQQTRLDAERIRQTGVDAIQVNTGKGCHLDANMVGAAFERLPWHVDGHQNHELCEPPWQHAHLERSEVAANQTDGCRRNGAAESLLLIENVGNLVCPALWDLGEDAKVVVLSVTEGDDKPLKYPDMFAAATLMLINKIDLLPYVDFDVDRCLEAVRQINPTMDVILVSAKTGEGIDDWIDWLLHTSRAPGRWTTGDEQSG